MPFFTPHHFRNIVLTLSVFCTFCATNVLAQTGTWSPVTTPAPHYNEGVMLLLTDGTVICKTGSGGADLSGSENIGNVWDKLTPVNGSYANGTWSTIAPMDSPRLYFSSQVLRDGRVYVCGGEYGGGGKWGEIYNPATNTWSFTGTGGSGVGFPFPNVVSDANSEILPDGRILQACVDEAGINLNYLYDPIANTYTAGPNCLRIDNEATWVKLPDNSVLFMDNYAQTSERYIPATNTWINDATAPVNLFDPYGFEAGAAFLLPNGKVWFIGSTPHTLYYTPSGSTAPGTWTSGPAIPSSQGAPDAAAAMLPNGHILLTLSPTPTAGDHFPGPTKYYEFDYATNTFTQITGPDGAMSNAYGCFISNMLDLPDGNVLFCDQGYDQYYIYTPGSAPLAAGRPTVDSVLPVTCTSYTITGKLFNGISEGAAYGDDWQMNTNFPIVRLTLGSNVYYATTSNWSKQGVVMTGSLEDTATFTLPPGLPSGSYSLQLIVNGNPSTPRTFVPGVTGIAVGTVTGTSTACAGTTMLFSDGVAGGTWSSGNTAVATVGSTGVVTAVGQGTTIISYTFVDACLFGHSAVATVTVSIPAAAITGASVMCVGSVLPLSDTTIGGIWSSGTTAVATIGTGGIVTCLAAGTTTISYTTTNTCGTTQATKVVTVNTCSPSINGLLAVCPGLTTTLTDVITGGTWSSGPTSVATIGSLTGIVTGILSGTTIITYTYAGGSSTAVFTVRPQPAAISGAAILCEGYAMTLSDATTGGTWSRSNPAVASINAAGTVTSGVTGTATITYTAAGCYVTRGITVADPAVWNPVGSLYITPGGYSTGFAVNRVTGTPYVAFDELGYGDRASVMKYNGSNWVYVGAHGFSADTARNMSISVDPTGTPWVGYEDSAKLSVKKFDGTNWVYVGSPHFSTIGAYKITLQFAKDGTPYISYLNYTSGTGGGSSGVVVKKFDGSSWVDLGSGFLPTGSVWGVDMKLDTGGTPYVCYSSVYTDALIVARYTGGYWEYVGTTGFALTKQSTLAIDGKNRVYVAYEDDGTSLSMVKTYDSTGTWSNVGSGVVSPGQVYPFSTYIAVDTPGTPYVSSYDNLYRLQTIEKYDGTNWVTAGNAPVSAAYTSYDFMAVDNYGTPYTCNFGSISYTTTMSVYKLSGALPISGPSTICTGSSVLYTDPNGGGTWSSSAPAIVGINATTGLATGMAAGTATISYATMAACGPIYATFVVTVSAGSAVAPINGGSALCTGATLSLSDGTTGGVWTTSDTTRATVSSTGIVTGMGPGTATISYSVVRPCGTFTQVKVITVDDMPLAGTVLGLAHVCLGTTSLLTDAMTGGTWSSGSTGVATVTTWGLVTGVAVGTATISYTRTNTCASVSATRIVTVNTSAVFPSPIYGSPVVCVGQTSQLTDTLAGGTWTSGYDAVATVGTGGLVTGITVGSIFISYTIMSTCGAITTVLPITVHLSPASISGNTDICAGLTSLLSDAVSGGTWSSNNLAVATVSSSGLVTAISIGFSVISYTASGCAAYATVVVDSPAAWNIVGNRNFVQASSAAFTAGSDGTPYAAFPDAIYGNKLSVMKYDGSSWVYIGTPGISADSAADISMALDPTGILYVTYSDKSLGKKATVKNYNGTSWADVGSPGISPSSVQFTSTAIANDGTPFAAYEDDASSGKATVKKFNGSSWVTVGSSNFTAGFAGNITLKLDTSGKPYIAYVDYFFSKSASVMRYNGSGWVYVGGPGFTPVFTPFSSIPSLAISRTNIPYVAFSQLLSSNKATVERFDGTSWVPVGGGTISAGPAFPPQIAIDTSGIIHVVYADTVSGSRLMAQKYEGGAWETEGNPLFSETMAKNPSVALDGTGTPFACWINSNYFSGPDALNVAKLGMAPKPINGSASLCVGSTSTLTDATTTGTWSSGNTLVATVGSTTGIVAGVASGTAAISYKVTAGCGTVYATRIVTVVVSSIPPISGTFTVCPGATRALSDASTGGTWSSTNMVVATIDGTTGIVSGLVPGTTTISYSVVAGACGMVTRTAVVTVNSVPAVGTIAGAATICVGATTHLTDPTTGGVWSSGSIGVASVSATGIVTGVTGGTAIISYTLTNACGSTSATYVVTVNTSAVTPGPINGTAAICPGDITQLTDATPGGAWSSLSPAIATITATGLVTGIAGGTSKISYAVTNGCGTVATTLIVTVNTAPAAGIILGTAGFCMGSTSLLTDATSGGVWSSTATGVATVGTSGLVTGVSAGTSNISYTFTNSCGSATATRVVTVSAPPAAGAIAGTFVLCAGISTSLSDPTSSGGGVWSSSITLVATVDASGFMTAVSAGTTSISYKITNTCGVVFATQVVTVNPAPAAGAIAGAAGVCISSVTSLSDASPGGSWSSSATGVATVGSSGLVTALSSGTTTISYTVTNSCGTAVATKIVTVSIPSVAGTIAGTFVFCAGSSTLLSDPTGTVGGAWSSTIGSVATIDASGSATATSAGTTTISYTISNSCGVVAATQIITINPLPAAGSISGTAAVCIGSTTSLSDTSPGGTWSSTVPGIATVGTSGLITGVSTGTTTISYTVSNGCGTIAATRTVTVGISPFAGTIAGTFVFCSGTSTALSDPTGDAGGVWSSTATAVATVAASGLATGVSGGTATISYAVTNSCGVVAATQVVTVVATTMGPINGSLTVCVGANLSLTDTSAGGVWSTPDMAIATIGSTGVVMGVSGGLAHISYTVTRTCGTLTRVVVVTVNTTPATGTIAGAASICTGFTTHLSDAVTGGTWSSGNTAVATTTSTGTITGVSDGTATISYTLTNGCGSASVTYQVTVSAPSSSPGPITGPATVCKGSTIQLSDIASAGIWSSATVAVATIGSDSGVLTGVAVGTSAITYTILNSCGALWVTSTVTVLAAPAAISGSTTICASSSSQLTDATAGGTWSSSTTSVATVGTSGLVISVATGTAVISYTSGLCAATVTVNVAPTLGWDVIGYRRFTIGNAGSPSMCANGGSIPYVSFMDSAYQWRASAMMYDGSNWVYIGTRGFSVDTVAYTSIAVDASGTPYVVYGGGGTQTKASVKKYDGTNWVNVGTPYFSASWVQSPKIVIASDNTPYVSYIDGSVSGKATVKKFNGSSWVTVGSVGFSPNFAYSLNLALDATGVPYVCFENGSGLTVMTFNGTAWANVGTAAFATTNGNSLTIDATGTPYVAYPDNLNAGKATVSKYNGSSWSAVGTAFSTGAVAPGISIALDGSGTPYVAYADNLAPFQTSVKRFDGTSWAAVGNTSFSDSANSPILVFDNTSEPYVLTNRQGLTMVDLSNVVLPLTGLGTLCTGTTTQLTDLTSGGTWSSGTTAVATVSSRGLVTGVATGTAVISYKVTASCGPAYATYIVTVSAGSSTLPAITGTFTVCTGATATLTDASPGGVWASSNIAIATIGSSTAVVSGLAAGTTVISYMVTGACGILTQTAIVTVNSLPAAGSIAGTSLICVGSTTHLTDATTGGSWSSGNPGVGTVGTTGIVTGITSGTATISYTLTNGCGSTSATYVVSVDPAVTAGTINGTATVCVGSATNLSDAAGGGVWSSTATGIATVASTGIVTGIATGTTTISYLVTTSCGTAAATQVVTVSVLPGAGTISGTHTVCIGATTNLTDATVGGIWSSGNTGVATVGTNGTVTGIANGTATISYTVSNFCGSANATYIVTVSPVANAGTITGTATVCVGAITPLTDATSSGAWSSVATGVATVATNGNVSGVSTGTATISYTVTTGCGIAAATQVVTVTGLPAAGAISGPNTLCAGATTNLTDGIAGGVWSSGNTGVATAGTTGIITGVTNGTATISYTVTNSCGPANATYIITVNTLIDAGTISGTASVCAGANTSLSDAAAGGVWSSVLPGIASVGTNGLVTGITAGTSTISYATTNSCGVAAATLVISVNSLPAAGSINGAATICPGSNTLLTDLVAGGVWSSTATGIAAIGTTGMASGLSAGTATISYLVSNGCGAVAATWELTVNPLPDAGTISGAGSVCAASAITLSDPSGDAGGAWSSDAIGTATVSATGIVAGITPGSATISYTVTNSCGTATATYSMTVNPVPTVSPINGASDLCEGSTVTLTDASSAGIWSSSAISVATISSSGSVTGIAGGTTLVSYTVGNSCGINAATLVITINPSPVAGAISGEFTVCEGAVTSLSDPAIGGTWSSTNTGICMVSTSGIATGVSEGTTTISYTVMNGCGIIATTQVVTINPIPDAGSILGTAVVCSGAGTLLSDPAAGGVWSSGTTAVATVGTTGSVLGISTGTSTISFTVTNSCGTATATRAVTVNPLPVAGSISGASTICAGGAVSLSDPAASGAWNSTATGVAVISATGLVTGISAGTSVISYTVTNSCGTAVATVVMTVNPLPAAGTITGVAAFCTGANTSLSDIAAGGTWSSINVSVATIASTGVVTGVSAGTSAISYTVINGCGTAAATQIVTVTALPDAGAISGIPVVCVASTTMLSDPATGGIWSSGTTGIAIVGTTGIVTGVAFGTATISYLAGNSCGTSVATTVLTVYPLPAAGIVNGSPDVCLSASILLSDDITGGAWSVSTTAASIGSAGMLTGIAAGTTVVSYSVTNSCGTAVATKTVTVDPLPVALPISGADFVCISASTPLSDSYSGGTWISSSPGVALVNTSGVVTGVSGGVTDISYTVANGCGTSVAIKPMTVNQLPSVSLIGGPDNVCQSSAIVLSDTSPGGSWSSGSPGTAIVGTTGLVSGVVPGSATISYAVTNTCGTTTMTKTITVNPLPAGISGVANICLGATTSLSDAGGGTWSSSNSNTVIGSSGAVTGMAAGISVITYTLPGGCVTTLTVTVVPTVTPAVSISAPTGDTVCSGTPILYTAMPFNGGTSPVYQWSVNGTASGVTSSTYSITPLTTDTISVSLSSSAACALPPTVTHSVITVVVPRDTALLSISVSPGDIVCYGSSVLFTANGINGGMHPVYIWSRNNTDVSTGANYAFAAGNDTISCRMVSSSRCAFPDTVRSNAIIVTVDTGVVPSVVVYVSPGTNVHPGETDTFTAVVTNGGPDVTYQWAVNTTVIPGATSSVFYRNHFAERDSVSCMVTGSGSCRYMSFNSVIIHILETGLEQIAPGITDIRLLPNPNSGQFTLKGSLALKEDTKIALEITDMLGQSVYNASTMSHNGSLNEQIQLSSELANGMYLLNVRYGSERKVFHFVLER